MRQIRDVDVQRIARADEPLTRRFVTCIAGRPLGFPV
jgi:hypothetical protein